jgi:tetratricopeptide (TPR) repeat protein
MKTARRHELQHNQLADWLGEKIEEVTPYSRTITAVVVGILALIAVMVIYNNRSNATEEAAWTAYFVALDHSREAGFTRDGRTRNVRADLLDDLTKVTTAYPKQAAGSWARLTMASMQLDQGIEDLFKDRETSKEELEDATKNFEKVLAASNDSSLKEQATLGLARTYEAESNLDEARKYYEKMVKSWPNGIYIAEAKKRLADLSNPSTKEFYSWFASQETKPSKLDPFGGMNFPGHPPMKNPSFPPLDAGSFSIPSDFPAKTDPAKTDAGKAPVTSDDPTTDGKKDGAEKKPADTKADEKKVDDKKADAKEPAKEKAPEPTKEEEKK